MTRSSLAWSLRLGLAGCPLAGCLLAGCQAESFSCEDDQACEGVGPGAQCEPNGYCSFVDVECDSGRRYGTLAGAGLGGQCVGPEADTDGPTTATTSPTDPTLTSDPTLDGGSTSAADSTSGVDTDPPPPADWWDCAWAARRTLTIQPPPLGEPQQDVPVLLVLDDTRIDPSLMASDGHDLRVLTEDGAVLDLEVEQWDPAGLSWVWIRVPALESPTRLLMYYGNPDASTLDGSFVWTSYLGVWHMGFELGDSTERSETTLSSVTTTAGQVATAQAYEGGDSGVQVLPARELWGLFQGGGTVSAMVRASGWGSSGQGPIVGRSLSLDGDSGWVFQLSGAREALRFSRDFSAGRGNWYTPDGSIALYTWHHVAVVYEDLDDAVEPALYIDGVPQPLDTQGSHSGIPDREGAEYLDIGGVPGSSEQWFHGVIDEVRVAGVPRSAEWMLVQSASLRDDLVVYGPQQSGCASAG